MSRREFSLEIFFFPFGYLAVPETPWSGNARVCVLCSFYEKSNVHELNAIISLKNNLYIQVFLYVCIRILNVKFPMKSPC